MNFTKLFDITIQYDNLHSKKWLEHTFPIFEQSGKDVPWSEEHVVSRFPELASRFRRDNVRERDPYAGISGMIFL